VSAPGVLATAIAAAPRVPAEGEFYRHMKRGPVTLTGSNRPGRWGSGGFSVLYLGRPQAAVVAEAYRWIVDMTDGLRGENVINRQLVAVNVTLTNVLDLRDQATREALQLPDDVIHSEVRHPTAYPQCNQVAEIAHQLGFHGIIAPAASGLGETLAVFTQRAAAANELPQPVGTTLWTDGLPADPRTLRVVRTDTA
jgi:RES domain-containing protein